MKKYIILFVTIILTICITVGCSPNDSTSYMVESNIYSAGIYSSRITYVKGKSMRMEETTSPTEKEVMIYNAAQGATYHYYVGSDTGSVSYNTSQDKDIDIWNYYSQYVLSFGDFPYALEEKDLTFKIEQLDGNRVVYIEVNGLDDGSYFGKLWFSTQFLIPLKSETSRNGKVVCSQTVTNFEPNKQIDNSMFTPPNNIDFSDCTVYP